MVLYPSKYFALTMLNNRNIDFVFYGHSHGGQIRILEQGLYASG